MAAVAHNPAFAKRVGIPQSVGKEFTAADKGKKFRTGGRPDLQKVNRPKTEHGRMGLFREGGEMAESKAMIKKEISFMKKKGAPKSMVKHEESEMKGMKKMAKGGSVAPSKMGAVKTAAPSRDGVAIKGKTKGKQIKMAGGKGMNKGGKC